MGIDPKQLSMDNLTQLALKLTETTEADSDGGIPYEEAQRRSQTALLALKDRLANDAQVAARALEAHEERPKNLIGWYEDFYRLLDGGWPWRIAVYIAWASAPKAGRYPKTQEELAVKILGLTQDRIIAKWRKNNPCIDETIAMMQAAPLLVHRGDIFQALAESASDPSFHGAQDRKTALTMLGDYIPHQKVEIEREKGSAVEKTDAELDEENKRLEAMLESRKRQDN
jgi:hypothetical protein